MPVLNLVPRRRIWRLCIWTPQLLVFVCFIYLVSRLVAPLDSDVKGSKPNIFRKHKGVLWKDDAHSEVKHPVVSVLAHNPPRTTKLNQTAVSSHKVNLKNFDRNASDSAFMEQQARVQRERHAHLTDACGRHPELSRGGLNYTTIRHLYVHEKQKMIYCFVPKAGCSNWKRVLMVLSGRRNHTDGISSNEAHHKNGMKKLRRYKLAARRYRLRTYTKFMFARHPFTRILSAYRNKFADVQVYRKEGYFQKRGRKIMKSYRQNATAADLRTGENITWHEWIAYLTNPAETDGFDDHWQEIYKMCSPCKVKYDYLGQLETVDDDAKYMLTSLGLQDRVSYPAKANSHPTNSSKIYDAHFSQVTKASLQKLWEIYRLDFELFGYSKPDFVS